MSDISCTACQELRESAPDFIANGVTEAVCESLAEDTGFDAENGHNDSTDLHLANDCLIGRMQDEINAYDICDWKEFMRLYANNDYETNKAIICALGGLWNVIHKLIEALGGGDGSIPVIRRYRVTVPQPSFGQTWRGTVGIQQATYQDPTLRDSTSWYNVGSVNAWFAGTGNNQEVGEFWIKVPISEMDSITGVWTQTLVVPGGNPYDGLGKWYMQTVNVQEWYKEGNYLNVNFDTYELCPPGGGPSAEHNGGPYPVTIDFLIVGLKRIL